MVIDVRTYTCRPGMLGAHLAVYEKWGKAAQLRHVGPPLAYLVPVTGNPNQFVHIWAYAGMADRDAKRKALDADAEWIKYRFERDKLGALTAQENKLMKPVDFFADPAALPAS